MARAFGLSAACLALACLAASPAGAAWTPPTGISETGITSAQPQVAVDAAGNTTAVWTIGTTGSRGIRSAFRPAGGPWQESVSRIGLTSTNDCHDPRLAVDPSGDAAVVAVCEKPSKAIRGAYRPGEFWSGGLEVPGSAGGSGARVGIDDAGKAVAVWLGSDSSVRSAYHPPSESWVADPQVSTSGKVALQPNLGVSPAGYAFAIWREERKNTPTDPVIPVQYSVRHGSAAWTTPSSLTINNAEGPVTQGEPQISINPGGERIMSWINVPSLSPAQMQDRSSSGDLGGNSEPARILGETGVNVEEPRIALGPSGLSLVTFLDSTEGVFRIRTATASSLTGAWSSPQTVSTPSAVTGVSYPAIAAAPTGDATVAYWGIPSAIYASSKIASGSFPSAVPISNDQFPGFEQPAVTTSEQGDSVAAWRSSGDPQIAIAVNDVTPPRLSGIEVPATTESGKTVTMRATSTDTWSPTTIIWNFGDGGVASGDAVNHYYDGPATRTVTVTARDAAGNQASETRLITVEPLFACLARADGATASVRVCQGNHLPPEFRHLAIKVKVLKQSWKQIRRTGKLKLELPTHEGRQVRRRRQVGAASGQASRLCERNQGRGPGDRPRLGQGDGGPVYDGKGQAHRPCACLDRRCERSCPGDRGRDRHRSGRPTGDRDEETDDQSAVGALALESPDFESELFDSEDFESELFEESESFDSPEPSEPPLPPPFFLP